MDATALRRVCGHFQSILQWYPDTDKEFWTLARTMERPWCDMPGFWTNPMLDDGEQIHHAAVLHDGRETLCLLPNWTITGAAQDAMRQYNAFVANLQCHIETLVVDSCFVAFTLMGDLQAEPSSVVPIVTGGYEILTFRRCFDYMRHCVAPIEYRDRYAYAALIHALSASHPKLAECISLQSPRSPRNIQRSARRRTCARLSIALLHCAAMCLALDPQIWIWVCKLLSYLSPSVLTALLESCSWMARTPQAILWLQLICIWNKNAASLTLTIQQTIQVNGPRLHWCTMRHFARLVYAAVIRGSTDCLAVLRATAPTHWTILEKPGMRFDMFDLELPLISLADLLVEHNIV